MEAPTTEVQTTESSFKSLAADVTKDTQQAETYKDEETVLVNKVVQSTSLTEDEATVVVQGLNIDYASMSTEEITAALLRAIATEQDTNKVYATPVQTTSTTQLMNNISLGNATNINTLASSPTNDLVKIIDSNLTGIGIQQNGQRIEANDGVLNRIVQKH